LTSPTVDVHELVAWRLDDYPPRASAIGVEQNEIERKIQQAKQQLGKRDSFTSTPALLMEETQQIRELLDASMQRADLHREFRELNWALGVVDLRLLLAFQRRLVFDPTRFTPQIPKQEDWPELVSLSMNPPRSIAHCLSHQEKAGVMDVRISSRNPDLQLRLNQSAEDSDSFLFSLYGGSPFIEVAEFRSRWFLRDGYHRAYRLLQKGVCCIPAVILRARTIEELGATSPWFFSEEELFSERPPRVIDFLDEALVLRYKRVPFRKAIRIRIEEMMEPIVETEVQGEKI
jgi:hypothetical protein